jgi:hypothetical protein
LIAEESFAGLVIPELEVTPDEASENDLEKFVELAFNEQITVLQTQKFYESLTDQQKEMVSNFVAIKADIPLEEWERERESYQSAFAPVSSETLRNQSSTLSTELWRQPIENTWTTGYPPGHAFAAFYYIDPYCEGGPNPDPDDDWMFYFPISYSMNPDGLRWTSDSAQVYLAFMTAYGGDLNGFAYTWEQVRLCIGTGGVTAAGGPNNVSNNLFVHPNN